MKKILLSFILLVFMSMISFAQPWMNSFPKEKVNNGNLTLYEIQQAFNDYWTPFNVDKTGHYTDSKGEYVKALGWKQFKRWEEYWETRVDFKTGKFPNTTAYEEFQKYIKTHPEAKSPAGNWISKGPSSSTSGYHGIGRISCVGFRPGDNNTIYAGAPVGGIWKSTDGGSNWTVLGQDNASIGVSDIVVIAGASTSSDIIYMATGDDDAGDCYSIGVLKSTDGGSTWNTTGLSFTASQTRKIYRLIMDPTNNSILYAATSVGVYKTTDAGSTWSNLTANYFVDLEFKPGNSTYIYGSNKYGDVYRSTNSGGSWTQVLSTADRRTELAVSANNSSIVYALITNSSSALAAVYKSTDSGASFTSIYTPGKNLLGWACDGSGTSGQGWYDLCIAADPTNANNVFVGGVNTWKSTDGGSTWNINNMWSGDCSGAATNVHADKHCLTFQNGTSTLFEGNDGGLYKTSDLGSTWSDITNGMVISQMYRIGVAQTAANDVVCGLQDNGTKNLQAATWSDVIGGDGMDCAIDFTDANTQYGEGTNGSLRRTTNHWGSSTSITSGLSGSAAWVTPFIIDLNSHNTVYAGYQDVFKSTNNGSSWTKISNWAGNTLRSLAIAPSNSNYICAATSSTIYRTTNGGTSWSDITSGLPSLTINWILIKDNDPNTIWVALGGFNSDGVYKSTNGGSTWSNISSGLPSVPLNGVVQNKLNTSTEELYAATDVGVYFKSGGANWQLFSTNLPNVVVRELEIYYNGANSKIYASTYGRGLWESDLYSPAVAPTADFTADNLYPANTSTTVTFTDTSSDLPSSWSWSFSPATVTYVGGTNSNSQNPQVVFNNNGAYTVSLTATNSAGSDGETKTNYIHVGQRGLWIGITNNDWDTASNWDNSEVPTSAVDVSIVANGAPNWPQKNSSLTIGTDCNSINFGSSVTQLDIMGNLTISSGKNLFVDPSGASIISVMGDWTNNGTFTAGQSRVFFNNIAAASIYPPPAPPTYLINDDMSVWPGNWSGDVGTGSGKFYQSSTSNAGGTSPEAKFTWANEVNTFRMIHSPINTSGLTAATLEFKHQVDNYSGSDYTIKAQYSIDGTTWNDLWSVSPTDNIAATTVSLPLTSSDAIGSTSYYIAFMITGNTYNINYWYIDDVKLSYPGVATETFYDLDIATFSNTVTQAGDVIVNNDFSIKADGQYTIPTGKELMVIGNINLKAGILAADNIYSFLNRGTITLGGLINYEQYLTGNTWHIVSPPTNTSALPYSGTYLYKRNEIDSTYTNITSNSYMLSDEEGYFAWATSNSTITFSGATAFDESDRNISLSYTPSGYMIGTNAGYHLIGNPYASYLNWNGSTNWNLNNVDATVYFWDAAAGQYKTWNGTTGTASSGWIPPTQGFYVKANATGASLTIPSSERGHSSQGFYKVPDFPYLKVNISGNNYSDEIILSEVEGSSIEFDHNFDAYHLNGIEEAPQLSLFMKNTEMTMNAIPKLSEDMVIPLHLSVGEENMYEINLLEETLVDIPNIYLEDILTNNLIDLKENSYEFSASPMDNIHRFNLRFSSPTNVEEEASNLINIFSVNHTIHVQTDIKNGEIKIYDILGQLVIDKTITTNKTTINLPKASGYYLVKVQSKEYINTQKVLIK